MSATAIPPWRINAEPTENEIEEFVKGFKVDMRVLEMLAHKIEPTVRKTVELQAETQAFTQALGNVGVSYVTVMPDGSKQIVQDVLTKAPDGVKELLAQDPWLCTGLQWKNIAMTGRMEICSEFGLDTNILLADDIRDVLPEESERHLESWQRLVNDGTAFNVGYSVGERADALIETGYLLLPPQRVKGVWNNLQGRHDVPAGMPGSPAFVRAMMGETYLAWIEAVR